MEKSENILASNVGKKVSLYRLVTVHIPEVKRKIEEPRRKEGILIKDEYGYSIKDSETGEVSRLFPGDAHLTVGGQTYRTSRLPELKH